MSTTPPDTPAASVEGLMDLVDTLRDKAKEYGEDLEVMRDAECDIFDPTQAVIEKIRSYATLLAAPPALPVRAEDAKDAQRYRWLRDRLLAADFAWGDPPVPVLVFSWPADVGVGGNCDQNIDAAIQGKERG